MNVLRRAGIFFGDDDFMASCLVVRKRRDAPHSSCLRLHDSEFLRSQSPALLIFAALCLHPYVLTFFSQAPPGLFHASVENKRPSANRRMRDPCVTLGPPLGGPRVALGWPNPRPNPTQQAEGRKVLTPRGANWLNAECRLLNARFSKIKHRPTPEG